jgi:hypothetical protein
MISYADFGENVEAHVLYALALELADGLSIFRQRLNDGTWRRAPGIWLGQLVNFAWKHKIVEDGAFRELRGALVRELVKLPVEREAHETLADFGPAGGSFLVLVSAPPMSLVRAWVIEPEEASILSSAADDGLDANRLRAIDNIIGRQPR